jgi:hypothetical protein
MCWCHLIDDEEAQAGTEKSRNLPSITQQVLELGLDCRVQLSMVAHTCNLTWETEVGGS